MNAGGRRSAPATPTTSAKGPALVESLASAHRHAHRDRLRLQRRGDERRRSLLHRRQLRRASARSGARGASRFSRRCRFRSSPATSPRCAPALFHTLILTKDKKLYALGRGRDGQLGNGKTVNGFALVPDMTDVVSFAAGTWHSVVARADGSVWAWGNGSKSQLCDGATTNRAIPAKVTLPAGVRVDASGGRRAQHADAHGRRCALRVRRQPVRCARASAAAVARAADVDSGAGREIVRCSRLAARTAPSARMAATSVSSARTTTASSLLPTRRP